MKVVKIKEEHYKGAFSVVSETFRKNNFEEGSPDAISRYVDYYNPENSDLEKMKKSFSYTPIAFVLLDNDRIVGVVRGRDNQLVNLFLLNQYHRKGYGKMLLTEFENEAINRGASYIKIRASLFATEFYQNQGYKKTTGVRNFRGLKIQPMIKKLSNGINA